VRRQAVRIAERVGLVLAHYDEDYDWIASITGQPTVGSCRGAQPERRPWRG